MMITKNTQKAAMFGLDARIALAIFGALSVITGASLYSAIQNIKLTVLIADIEEIGKAYDQYLLDTGLELEEVANTYLNIRKLVEQTSPLTVGWKGPYLPYARLSSDANRYLLHYKDNNSNVYISKSQNVLGTVKQNCVTSESCYIWTGMNKVPLYLAQKIDMKLDAGDGETAGSFRYIIADGLTHIYYQYRPQYQ